MSSEPRHEQASSRPSNQLRLRPVRALQRATEGPSNVHGGGSDSASLDDGGPDGDLPEDDFRCPLCVKLLFEPVTTRCGEMHPPVESQLVRHR
eukprot:COSAG02_NODE_6743_length_3389_cov_1.334347_2_plen_93_part_00